VLELTKKQRHKESSEKSQEANLRETIKQIDEVQRQLRIEWNLYLNNLQASDINGLLKMEHQFSYKTEEIKKHYQQKENKDIIHNYVGLFRDMSEYAKLYYTDKKKSN
jgi:hypothetical protein